MNYALISILGLVLAIAIGTYKKVNIGVISLCFAFILGFFVFDMNVKEIYTKGWPIGIFFIMLSAMFLFSFANVNGTMKLLSAKLAYAIKGNVRALPLVFFAVTAAMTACGADPTVIVFLLPVAFHIGRKADMHPMILCVSVLAASMVGSACSKLAVIGIVTSGLALKEGVGNYFPIAAATTISSVSFSMLIYILYKGWKINKVDINDIEKPESFDLNQKKTLCIIAFVIFLILFVKMDIAAAAFIGSSFMLILKVANEKEAIKTINWSVLLMVGGTGVLVHVMTEMGGVTMLSKFLSSIMTVHTAAPLMALISGAMTFVSSATGVVMPALFPTVPGIVSEMSGAVQPLELMQAIQAGSIGSVVYSPLSALGAVALSSIPDDTPNKDKLFTQMILIAFGGLVWTIFLSFTGIFRFLI